MNVGGQSYQFDDTFSRDVVVVASAGNDSTCRPSWPAAFEDVIAVGALNGGQPSWFTNWGPWIAASAQGVDLISRFFTVQPGATAYGDLASFNGWASWSGTSFSAPIVAGVIAHDVATGGGSVRDAVERVIEHPDLMRLHGLGTVINVR